MSEVDAKRLLDYYKELGPSLTTVLIMAPARQRKQSLIA